MSRGQQSPVKVRNGAFESLLHHFGPEEPATFASFDSSHLVFSLPAPGPANRSTKASYNPAAFSMVKNHEIRSKPSPKRGRDAFEEQNPSALSTAEQVRSSKRRALNVIAFDNCTFTLLPDELKKYIFSFLPQEDAGNVHSVCWSWYRNASDDYIWSRLYLQKWNFRPEQDPYLRELRISFKILYRMRLTNERDRFLDASKASDETNKKNEISTAKMFQKWGESFSREAGLHGTSLELARELYTVALQQFHSAHIYAPDSSEILMFWGDTIADLATITPASSSIKPLLDIMSRQKYTAAKALTTPTSDGTPSAQQPLQRSESRPSIFEELQNVDITWDNFYSDPEDDDNVHPIEDDDRMDVS